MVVEMIPRSRDLGLKHTDTLVMLGDEVLQDQFSTG